ncbi:MAG: SurA N-terminal domain-containing protein [Terriglobales bacterium]
MGRQAFILVFVAAFLALSFSAASAEVIDRIVATVNGHIILQSDWDDALRYEAFSSGRPLESLSAEDRKAALDRLIDQELLREQLRSPESAHATGEEVGKRVAEIRKQYPSAASDSVWQAVLQSYRLTEEELKLRVALELDLMSLVDSRLRPSVSIDSKSIESYYQVELLPRLRQSGGQNVPLAEVSGKIKELLIQKKITQLLTAWLRNLRAGSEIRAEALTAQPGSRSQ